MMLAALAGLALLQGERVFGQLKLPETDGQTRQIIHVMADREKPPKLSPKRFGEDQARWEFEWQTVGFSTDTLGSGRYPAKFAIWSQQRKSSDDAALQVCRTMLRLWSMNRHRLRLDHNPNYNGGIVDVYICWGGTPGGEQLLDFDPQVKPIDGSAPDPRGAKVNTIYLYNLASFTEPVEMLREVAHEYGHATLPAQGGFREPEAWANGLLGEKLYLMWMLGELRRKTLAPVDAMGVAPESLAAWVKANVDPLIARAALNGPDYAALGTGGADAMDAYIGLALYSATVLPETILSRALRLTSTLDPKAFPAAIALAAEEPARFSVKVPAELKGKPIWIPLGKGKVTGATVVARNGAWAKIKVGTGEITVYPVRSL